MTAQTASIVDVVVTAARDVFCNMFSVIDCSSSSSDSYTSSCRNLMFALGSSWRISRNRICRLVLLTRISELLNLYGNVLIIKKSGILILRKCLSLRIFRRGLWSVATMWSLQPNKHGMTSFLKGVGNGECLTLHRNVSSFCVVSEPVGSRDYFPTRKAAMYSLNVFGRGKIRCPAFTNQLEDKFFPPYQKSESPRSNCLNYFPVGICKTKIKLLIPMKFCWRGQKVPKGLHFSRWW